MKESPVVRTKPFSLEANNEKQTANSNNNLKQSTTGVYSNYKNKTDYSGMLIDTNIYKNSKLNEESNTCANTKNEQATNTTVDYYSGNSHNKSNLFKSSYKVNKNF